MDEGLFERCADCGHARSWHAKGACEWCVIEGPADGNLVVCQEYQEAKAA